MSYSVVPVAEVHLEGLHHALDVVARERRYLAFTQAPALETSLAFYRNIIAGDLCQFVALEGRTVVGWCDILPTHGEARSHVGHLGIGLIPTARHKGLGARLLEATIAKAHTKGLTRIELAVRTDNTNAKALYMRFGFLVEAVQQRSVRIDGEYHDVYAMALLL
ncbi:MAG: GNAT family N-acetyltransferase [Burkholderiaceae bacterium]|nr:GNAT family N-acetyltransferase [Burkholderiaceae bacterium]